MFKIEVPVLSSHENVMLLTMSTLPFLPKVNTYQIEEGGKTLYFKSLSQMEPHTKYVIYKLAAAGEVLDRIIILESLKAGTEKPENWGGETATTFYEKRIANYLGGNEELRIDIPDELEAYPESTPAESRGKKDGRSCSLPTIIKIDLEDPVFFWHAVNAIRGKDPAGKTGDGKDGKNTTIHLYMDMQGGDRNSVSQMNAITELLKRQGVTIQGRYANDFEAKKKKPLHTIRNADSEYRTYDLISAMDVFTRYGWGDSLEDYFRANIHGSSKSKEQRLVKAIQQASSAISKCNADGFDAAVRKIEGLKADYDNSDRITELDVVYQDIEEDYGTLFGTDYPHVAQIRWCLDKKFLQQALTIFEAKMPQDFILSGMLYYLTKDSTKQERQTFLETCETIYDGLPGKDRYRMKDINHYLIKDYSNGFDRGTGRFCFQDPEKVLHFGLGEEKKRDVVSLLDEYRSLCNLRNQMNHATAGRHNEDGFFRFMKNRRPNDRNWKENPGTNYEILIRDYLDKWERLARQVPEELRKNILDLS